MAGSLPLSLANQKNSMQLLTASWLYLLLATTTTVVHVANAAAMVCPNTEEEADNVVEADTIGAQAYKPNAPIKTSVCEELNDGSGGGPHRLAHWSFWRSNYKDLIPISFTGNIYSCNSSGDNDVMKPITTSNNEDSVVVVEVWQPRPDGTYSSIRPGVEEGDCRASVPVTIFTQQQRQHDDEDENENNNNVDDRGRIGSVKFDTFIPGSTGILNGLVPPSSSSFYNDYPPYKSGSIHLFLNIQGFSPLLVSLDMNELESWFPKRHVGKKRFQLSGGSNKKKKKKDGNDGMEIQSVTPKTITTKSRSAGKYHLAIDLEVNFFLTKSSNNHDVNNERKKKEGVAAGDGGGDGASTTLQDIFCSKKKKSTLFGRIISFFKEPISVCSPAYLDFFAL